MEAVRERMQMQSHPPTPSEEMPPSSQDWGVQVSSEHKSTWTGDLPASIEGTVLTPYIEASRRSNVLG